VTTHCVLAGEPIRKEDCVMNCYFCESEPAPGGMHFGILAADGVCHQCGVAVCRQHGRRDRGTKDVLLCQGCVEAMAAKLERRETVATSA
jgi:hypothetical protein